MDFHACGVQATDDMSEGTRGVRDAITLVLGTGFCLGAVVAFILNLILPQEADDAGAAQRTSEYLITTIKQVIFMDT